MLAVVFEALSHTEGEAAVSRRYLLCAPPPSSGSL